MAQARKVGREYAITNAVTEIIHIPSGFEHAGQTIINDGTEDIFWREYDPTITYAGTIAELIAEALGGSRLEEGDSVEIAALDIVAVCSTDEQETTSTLRVAPGRLNKDDSVVLAALAEDIAEMNVDLGKSTADTASVLYDGGDTANAMRDTIATSALPTGAAVIATAGFNALDIQMFNASVTEAFTLMVSEYSAATPTIATLVRQTPVSFPGSDQGRTVDRACVGLATGVEIYVKSPARVAVKPGSYVQLSIVENITGANYARYSLHGSV